LSFTFASEEASLQTSGRFLAYGSVGDDLNQNKTCYIYSARYQTRPTGASGDIFAAAMGYNIVGVKQPWTALAYVAGNVDLTYYTGNTSRAPDQVTVDAGGAIVAWTFAYIGEFCDNNTQEGFQPNSADYIINYFPAWIASYDQSCGAWTAGGVSAYWSTIQSRPVAPLTNSNFNTTCVVVPSRQNFNGRSIGDLTFKCDVHIDYNGLWSILPFQVRGCPSTQRKIGLLLQVAGAAFDVDVRVNNINSAAPNSVNRISFGSGRLAFTWENFHARTSSLQGVTGAAGVVTAAWLQGGNSTYKAATVSEEIIFSFQQSMAQGSFFHWDPSITATGTSTFASLFLVLVAFLLY